MSRAEARKMKFKFEGILIAVSAQLYFVALPAI
jgi:hypothetical protein